MAGKTSKIWIDILTPKQVNFFIPLIEQLRRRRIRVLTTSRRYEQLDTYLKIRRLRSIPVGRHGGRFLGEKLRASLERARDLVPLAEKFQPDLALSFVSPETARVSFGLDIPHFTVSDSPHSVAVSKLTLPLSSKLFSPKIIPVSAWTRFGIAPEKIVRYNGLDPVAWIQRLKPDTSIFVQLGIDAAQPVVTVRMEESHAAYLRGKVSDPGQTIRFVKKLKKMSKDCEIVILPRYRDQIRSLRKSLADKALLATDMIDAFSLVSHSAVFVGAGGTMTAEAALLGVPTVSCYPGEPTLVDQYLIKKGLVTRLHDPSLIASLVSRILRDPKIHEEREREAKALVRTMEDPVRIILRHVLS